MPGFTRRSKPLKATTDLANLTGLVISNPANGDLLIYNSADAEWQNGKTLTGDYSVVGSLTAQTLTATTGITTAALDVTANATIGGNLTVTGTLTSGNLAIVDLTVSGNSTFAGTVAISGLLTGAGFSFSGAGTVAGALTLGSTLSVTGAATFSSTLSAGVTTLAALTVTGNTLIGGNTNVIGNVTAANVAAGTLSASGTISGGSTLTLNSAVYTNNDITFFDDGTAIQIYNGALAVLTLDAASITEGAGVPTTAAGRGSLWLRNDGPDNGTLYYYGPSGWRAVSANPADLDFLMQDWATRQEYILTGSLEAGDATFSTARVGELRANALPWNIKAPSGYTAFGITDGSPYGFQTSMYGQATGAGGAQVPGTAKKFTTTPYGGRYMGRSVADGTGSDDTLLEFYDSTETTRHGYFWFKHFAASPQFTALCSIDDAIFKVFGQTAATQKTLLWSDPAAETRLYYAGTEVWRTASNGFRGGVSDTGVGILYGTATPEGAVTAPVGSIFLRTDGGAATSLYVKETGAGNTGWVGK